MDSRQAREVLTRYRPGERATDVEVGEALEQARRDPQLAAWYAAHRAAMDKAATEPGVAPAIQPAPAVQRSGNKAVLVLVLLAATVLLAFMIRSLNAPKPKDAFISYRDRMARLVQRAYPVKVSATDQSQLREYFRTNSGMANFVLRHNLEKLPARGGAVFPWHNIPVSLMSLDAGGGTNLYVFIIKRSAFQSGHIPEKTEFGKVGNLMTASWATNNQVYVLTGPGDEAWLRNFSE